MKIKLKRLTENELELLMKWRMSDEVNKYMTTSPKLTLEGQYKWFEKIKGDRTQVRWIIWADDTPIGSIYLTDIDYDNKRCESGWFIAEKGYLDFAQVLSIQKSVTNYVFKVMKLNRIYGYVMDNNLMLLRMIKLCGYRQEGVLTEHIIKDAQKYDLIIVGTTINSWKEQNESKYAEDIEIE